MSQAATKTKVADPSKKARMLRELTAELTAAFKDLDLKAKEGSAHDNTLSESRLQELTEKELLAKQLEQLISMLPTAIIVIDGEGVVQHANPAAEELLHCPLIGNNWRDIVQQAFKPQASDGCDVSLADGRLVNITTKALPDQPGQLIVLNDLTDTRRLQQQIARDQQLKEMGKMVASLAHQVRTPLSAALIYASTISRKEMTKEQVGQLAQKIKVRLQNIEQQVKDMLLCAKGGHLPLSTVKLSDFLDQLQDSSVDRIHLANAKLAVFNHCGEAYLKCHTDTLLGAFFNLINNALENAKDNLQLTVTATVQQQKYIVIQVEDNGQGMDKATVSKVTEPFFTTRQDGTGLGLDIVRAVVDEHHGQLHIESQKGIGTKVTIALPKYTSSC